LQQEERERLDRKIRIREALAQGTPISEHDLEMEAKEKEYGFAHQIHNNNNNRGNQQQQQQLDNEYAMAGLHDPKILLTSSHEPSDSMNRFLKELRYLFPNCQRVNRGSQQLSTLVQAAIRNGFSDVIVVHESRGTPDSLIVSHLPHGPTAYFTLYNVVMRHDVLAAVNNGEDVSSNTMPQVYPHLIFHNFKTRLGDRVATILKYLFPVPNADSKRVITFANQNDFISFRHHTYTKNNQILLKEIGPRFEMMCYQIKLGTLDMKDAENEWVLRPNMNTAKKRQALGISKEEQLEQEQQEWKNAQ
jgi:U3 small nucleolar ribonucleoprotein protein IMP4